MILTKRQQSLFRGNSGSIIAANARATADSVITALSPAAWYRNATGVTEAGGFASQWDDYSGNARHLVQATGTNQPAYSAGVFTFDGADNFLKAAAFTLNQPLSAVLVLQQESWTSNEYIFDGNTPASTVLRQFSSTPIVALYAGASAPQTSNLAVGAFGIACCVFNGASSKIRINNNAATTGNAGAKNAGGFLLGSAAPGGTGASNFSVKEIVIFPTALSDAEQDSVITALNNALTVF